MFTGKLDVESQLWCAEKVEADGALTCNFGALATACQGHVNHHRDNKLARKHTRTKSQRLTNA
jgi:hypothetical protein